MPQPEKRFIQTPSQLSCKAKEEKGRLEKKTERSTQKSDKKTITVGTPLKKTEKKE